MYAKQSQIISHLKDSFNSSIEAASKNKHSPVMLLAAFTDASVVFSPSI